jgi:hypothetical protein
MIDFVETVDKLDRSIDLHIVRLLILISTFAEKNQCGIIEGLTKLAKLDFLLRYPIMLERALLAKKRSIHDVALENCERYNVESEMVRYRFGPWDHRYREYLNVMVAKNLVKIIIEGRKIIIMTTKAGQELAQKLSSENSFIHYTNRAKLLRNNFDLTATNLMRFIYDTFPEIISLKSNTRITI